MDGQTDREIELMKVGIQTNRRMKSKMYRQMEERTDRQDTDLDRKRLI